MSTFSFSQCSSSLFLSASFWKKYTGMDRASRKISLLPEEKLQANYRLVHSFYVCAARGMSALPHSLPPRHIPHHPSSLLADGAADVLPSVIKAPCSLTRGWTWWQWVVGADRNRSKLPLWCCRETEQISAVLKHEESQSCLDWERP